MEQVMEFSIRTLYVFVLDQTNTIKVLIFYFLEIKNLFL